MMVIILTMIKMMMIAPETIMMEMGMNWRRRVIFGVELFRLELRMGIQNPNSVLRSLMVVSIVMVYT